MNILYLHGLDGELSPEKEAVLSEYGTVLSPKLDYRSDNHSVDSLTRKYAGSGIDVVIGTSMGGFVGYYLSAVLHLPCLLFNPALPYRSVEQHVPAQINTRTKYLQLVIGQQDDVIKAPDCLLFLQQAITPEIPARIHILNQLAHRIPVPVFKTEVAAFFNILAENQS